MTQNYARSNKNDYQIAKYVDNLEERVLGEKNHIPTSATRLFDNVFHRKIKGNVSGYWNNTLAKEKEKRFPQVEKNYKRGFVWYYITHSPVKILNIYKKEHMEAQA